MCFPGVLPSAKFHSSWQNAPHTILASFTDLQNVFRHKIVFSCKLVGSSIQAVGASIELVKTSIDSTESSSFLQFLLLASTKFHRLPITSAKSPYACISYHELQVLPPSVREGRSFPSTYIRYVLVLVFTRFRAVALLLQFRSLSR